MKLQVDTENKTIKVDENVKFSELIKVLSKLLPKEWKEYTLEPNSVIQWGTYPVYPWIYKTPWVIGEPFYTTCDSADQTSGGIYNIDVQN